MNLSIVAHPNSRKPRIEKDVLGEIHVYVRERPQDGKANQAIIASLAEYYDQPKSQIEILKGLTAKQKVIRIPEK